MRFQNYNPRLAIITLHFALWPISTYSQCVYKRIHANIRNGNLFLSEWKIGMYGVSFKPLGLTDSCKRLRSSESELSAYYLEEPKHDIFELCPNLKYMSSLANIPHVMLDHWTSYLSIYISSAFLFYLSFKELWAVCIALPSPLALAWDSLKSWGVWLAQGRPTSFMAEQRFELRSPRSSHSVLWQ